MKSVIGLLGCVIAVGLQAADPYCALTIVVRDDVGRALDGVESGGARWKGIRSLTQDH
jgi:hypothetical protein